MNRTPLGSLRLWIALLVLGSAVGAASQDPPTVRAVDRNQAGALSRNEGEVIVATLKESGHGHDVVVVPGSDPNRLQVYDGNLIGALKDLAAGKPIENPTVEKKVRLYLTDEYDKARYQKSMEDQRNRKLSDDQKTQLLTVDEALAKLPQGARAEKLQAMIDRYSQKGNSWTISFSGQQQAEVKFFSVPGNHQELKKAIGEFAPPAAATPAEQNLRCNALIKAAVPTAIPKTGEATANAIADHLSRESAVTRKAEAAAPVQRPPDPTPPPVYEEKSREQKVVPKPGGVIISATAVVEGLAPGAVSKAELDAAAGTLVLTLASGGSLRYAVDVDDFTVAVRCVFVREVDPSLSMSYSDKPGYHAVNYCGPLFKTRFGKVLYETDHLLGAIIFNREGAHRSVAADLMPAYLDLAFEAHETMGTGSRVFLHAKGVSFKAGPSGTLECTGVTTAVDVEGLGYGASYYQKSLHELARLLDANFDGLAEQFGVFAEFRKLAEQVALVKWIKANRIPLDVEPLKSSAVREVDFPAYSPSVDWYFIFNGRTLDGWRAGNLTAAARWTSDGGALTLTAGDEAIPMLRRSWRGDFDVQYTLSTRGPVELIIRKGDGAAGSRVTIDTKGKVERIETFLLKGDWTVVSPGLSKKGRVEIPEPAKDKTREPNEYGLNILPGSQVSLYCVLQRSR